MGENVNPALKTSVRTLTLNVWPCDCQFKMMLASYETVNLQLDSLSL